MGTEEMRCFSRFAVLCEGVPAWAVDGSDSYRYDGLLFWRRGRSQDSYQLVVSWLSPPYGWRHEGKCSCRLCGPANSLKSEAA